MAYTISDGVTTLTIQGNETLTITQGIIGNRKPIQSATKEAVRVHGTKSKELRVSVILDPTDATDQALITAIFGWATANTSLTVVTSLPSPVNTWSAKLFDKLEIKPRPGSPSAISLDLFLLEV